MSNLVAKEYIGFESIKHCDDNGNEYWQARELCAVLQYTQWRNFENAIDRAMLACQNSGFIVIDHFAEVSKTVEMPSNAKPKLIKDYNLTRYACYLIVQNGDPRKEIIALGQTYFAIQTRRQEVQDYFNQLDEDNRRLVVRGDIKQWNQMLAETAHKSGVITDEEFATFQNAGYMGLYGGETVQDIHSRKNLRTNEKVLDFMSSPELIANLFRISQTDEKLKKEKIASSDKAIEAHMEVGSIVREAIAKAGGTLPEDMPTPSKGISEIQREQLKKLKAQKHKMLDE